jgi:CheY-like chemotaxis protein
MRGSDDVARLLEEEGGMSQSPLILVCDDTKPIAASLVFMLQNAGYRAQAASDALECVGLARRQRPDLIIMDIMMPGMDGAMATELMAQYPELEGIPVILLSAMPEEEVRAKAHDAGAVDFILKPWKKDSLLATVRRWAPEPAPSSPPAVAS